jgi:hypothetical protein
VSPDKPTLQKSPIVSEILRYLANHPQAQDTVEGIVEWWLLEQRLTRATAQVKTALEQLVTQGLVIASEETAGRVYYRVNRQKLREIRLLGRK